jgi:phage terminase large subunit GpA-like protein
LDEKVDGVFDKVKYITPVSFNEEHRYLPAGVTPRPGYIRYDLFPYLKEIIECFDRESPVREVNLMKGVQTGYTTLLESVLLYYIGHVKTKPVLFVTADKELANVRVENNILPMIQESGMSDLIRSADEGNNRKSGKTKNFIQWDGGGNMVYTGAQNAAKMRMNSMPILLKDEIDGWKSSVGDDGDPDKLTDDRARAYWAQRKILRGSTPTLAPSMIHSAYEKGDQRKYHVLCKKCSYPQYMVFNHVDKETGVIGGLRWEMEGDTLITDSVRYCCIKCGHGHVETDKEYLFSEENGAHWKPTAQPKEKHIRSYHLPAFYSPYGFGTWYKCVTDYIESYDVENRRVLSIAKYQQFYNNTLGTPFRPFVGSRINFMLASSHRRAVYNYGQIPNNYANTYSGSKIQVVICTVDVQKKFLSVSTHGFCVDQRSYLIDYFNFEVGQDEPDCTELDSPSWRKLRSVIEETEYIADDGARYQIALTLIDAGYANDTVCRFCSDYASGVYPILGRDRPAKHQTIKEFADFRTQVGTVGYRILVDHYKDRMFPVLRREWSQESGEQPVYHFNAPINCTDEQLKELTVEELKTKRDDRGRMSTYWHRPSTGARNELWDLICYAHAGLEILAYSICIEQFGADNVDWPFLNLKKRVHNGRFR